MVEYWYQHRRDNKYNCLVCRHSQYPKFLMAHYNNNLNNRELLPYSPKENQTIKKTIKKLYRK